MSKSTKNFDAVEMMRTIRAEISDEISGMTLEEEVDWLESAKLPDETLRLLRDRAREKSTRPNE